MPAVLVRRLDRPPARHGALARAAGRAGERGRYPAGVLRLHGARVPLPGAVCQSVPAPPAQARVRVVRAHGYGPRCYGVRAHRRDRARGSVRPGARHRARRRTVPGVRRHRRLRFQRVVASRVRLFGWVRLLDGRLLFRHFCLERPRRRAQYDQAAPHRALFRRSDPRGHSPRRTSCKGWPGGACGGASRGGVGSVPVPAHLLHRLHHAHGVCRVRRDRARRSPRCLMVGRSCASSRRGILERPARVRRAAGRGTGLELVDGPCVRVCSSRRRCA